MIASEKRHNTNLLDASFSSYATQERFIIKLSHPQKKKAEDDELGIFGAEKYFTGAIDHEQLNKTPHYQISNKPQNKLDQPSPIPKPKQETQSGTPSVRSESSWNSRRGLLVTNANDHRKKTGVKSLLASLGCNCNDKASVKVTNNKLHANEAVHVKTPVNSAQKTKSLSSRWTEDNVPMNKFELDGLNTKRDDCFTFPVLKHSEPPEVERKPTLLNWDKDNINNDTGSDASSDLFEIESFSTKALEISEGRLSNVNGYAPSEVSVDWSVVTACAEDLAVSRIGKVKGDIERVKGSGILSGCHSLKAVRVSGDEYCVMGGGEKVPPAQREWCRRLDSVTPIAKIQAESKLVGLGCDLKMKRGQSGFGTTRLVPRTHNGSHYLNI